MNMLRAVWAYRGFIGGSVRREFQSRYRNSLLGGAWTVLQPLAMIVVYAVVFGRVMQARLPGEQGPGFYGIYLCAGLLTWGLFAEIIQRGQTMFLDNANLMKKLNFPRACLPAAVVVTAFANFTIIFGLFTAYLLLCGRFPGWPFIALIPVLAVQVLLASGLAVLLGVLNVFFRDVGHLTGIALQFWFWLTPIVYVASILPERVQDLVALNPMASLVHAYQDILVTGSWPHWGGLVPAALISVAACWLATRVLQRHGGELVDEL